MSAPDEQRHVEIEVEAGIARLRAPGFALPAVLRAAYYRVGAFHVACDLDDGAPVVTLSPRRPVGEAALEEAIVALARDLEDAELRLALLDGNRADREYLFARALFGAEAADQERMLAELAGAGAGDDPLGIAVPWEEKYARREPREGGQGEPGK
jgi:hypothetical protein